MELAPFHSIVFCESLRQLELFPQHERVSRQIITCALVGDDRRDLHAIALAEMYHQVGLKLSLGQRVAVLVDDLTLVDKQQLMALATKQGACITDMNRCNGIAQALPSDISRYVRENWKGITVIGDVHGDLHALIKALAWAEGRRQFVWFLGDVIDYGPQSLATVDLVYRVVMAGSAAMLIGNHERKIARWLDQPGKRLRLNDGNRVTIAALEALTPTARQQWIGRFRGLLSHATLMQQIDSITLVHAAVHPSLWGETPNPCLIEQFALYGEADHSSGKFRRVHRWIDAIPKGQTVFVGHDVIAEFPIVITGNRGGHVVHLDTGCGTGGYLSTADLRFDVDGLHLECFNRH